MFGKTAKANTKANEGFQSLLNTKNPITTLLFTIPETIKPKLNMAPTIQDIKQSPTLLAAPYLTLW